MSAGKAKAGVSVATQPGNFAALQCLDAGSDGQKYQQLTVFELGDAEQGLAEFLGVALNVSIDVHGHHFRADLRAGFEGQLRMGLRLMAIKQACKHGDFEQCVAGLGIGNDTASRRMRLVKAICAEGDVRRQQALIEMGQTKALGLLAASPVVRDQVLEDAGLLRKALEGTTRAFEQRIHELEAKAGNLNAELVMSNGAVEALSAKLIRLEQGTRNDNVPPMVAALRAELLVLTKKAELAIEGVRAVGVALVGLAGNQVASPWADGTLRLAVTGLASIGLQLQGVLKQYLKAAPEVDAPLPAAAYLSQQELVDLQMRFNTVAGTEALEASQRRVDAINAEKDATRSRGARLKRPGAKEQTK